MPASSDFHFTQSLQNCTIKKPPSINPPHLYSFSMGKNIARNTVSTTKRLSVTKRQSRKLERLKLNTCNEGLQERHVCPYFTRDSGSSPNEPVTSVNPWTFLYRMCRCDKVAIFCSDGAERIAEKSRTKGMKFASLTRWQTGLVWYGVTQWLNVNNSKKKFVTS